MISVEEINRSHHDFYLLMGPFFGSRKVAKEVGINIYDDLDKRWFLAFSEGMMLGFASVRGGLVSDCYVLPSWRHGGVFTSILSTILQSTEGNLKANCTSASKKAFANAGFAETRKTKNFTFMEMNRA